MANVAAARSFESFQRKPALRVKMTFMRIQNDIHVEMALILTHLSANQISIFSITQHSR